MIDNDCSQYERDSICSLIMQTFLQEFETFNQGEPGMLFRDPGVRGGGSCPKALKKISKFSNESY